MGESLFPIDIEDSSAFALLMVCFGEIPRDLVLRGKLASENFDTDGMNISFRMNLRSQRE